jgi:hypothetical protein
VKASQAVVAHYERQLRQWGPTARGMDWKDEASQRLRFEVLAGVCDLAGRTICEVGAGAGHLYDFLRERGVADGYSGIDLSAEMVAAACRRHPDVRFEQRDLLADPPPEPADVVVCSGLFHVKLDHGDEEWWAFVEAMLERMFAACRVAIAFNLMTDQVDFRSPTLYYANPGEVLDFCRRRLGRFVTVRHDYRLHEFTVYAYRDPPAPAAPPTLSVVMAGLDEEQNVERAVGRMVQGLEALGLTFEVIVIDDGSTDRTGEIADRMAAADPRIRVLHNERNLNYGVSLARGIRAARGDWVLHDGMDLPLAPEDIAAFVPHFADADVLVARRIDRTAHSAWRRLTSWTNNLLLRLLFRPRTGDLNFVQFYRRAVADALPLRSTSPAFVTPELIIRAERAGRRVREIEVEFRRRQAGRGHFGKPRDILWTLRDMLRLRLRTWFLGWER